MSTVLLVDDDEAALNLMQRALEADGYVVETATDGKDALERLDALHPDLLLSDVVMPRMSGFALLSELRRRPEFATLPVVLLTGLVDGTERAEAYRLGVDDYITKPPDLDELSIRLRNLLARRNAEAPGLGGCLAELGVCSLFGVLDNDRKEGVLSLSRGPERAEVRVRGGRVVSACFVGRDEPTGAECVYELLTWRDGSFAFASTRVDVRDQIDTPTVALLLEGMRRIDAAANVRDEGSDGLDCRGPDEETRDSSIESPPAGC